MFTSAMILYMTITAVTPGPNNLTMLYLGGRYGLKGTRNFLSASVTSLFIKCLLCGLLNLMLAKYIPLLVDYLKWIGAAYMIYLGIMMGKSGWNTKAEDKEERESTYLSGIILQILNMKSWVSALSIFAVYVMPHHPTPFDILLVSLLYTGLVLLSSLIWGTCGSFLRSILTKYKKPFGILLGASLIYCAITAVL